MVSTATSSTTLTLIQETIGSFSPLICFESNKSAMKLFLIPVSSCPEQKENRNKQSCDMIYPSRSSSFVPVFFLQLLALEEDVWPAAHLKPV